MDLPLILGLLQGSLRLLLVDKVSAENLHTHTNPSLSLNDKWHGSDICTPIYYMLLESYNCVLHITAGIVLYSCIGFPSSYSPASNPANMYTNAKAKPHFYNFSDFKYFKLSTIFFWNINVKDRKVNSHHVKKGSNF